MNLTFYMDVHVPLAITDGLRNRGVDVVTAQEDGARRLSDPALLDRAMALGRVLLTRDDDFLAEGMRRQRDGVPFAGVVYMHQGRLSIGECIVQLELLSRASNRVEMESRVLYLPLTMYG